MYLADVMVRLTFLYCLCSSIIYYKRLNNNIEKKIGLAFILFMSFFLLDIIFSLFLSIGFLTIFLFFMMMNILSIIFMIYFLKFNNNSLDVQIDINKSFDLTPREIEVFHLIKKGMSYKEICEELLISIATVKTHLNKIYKKTNTKSRFELTARF